MDAPLSMNTLRIALVGLTALAAIVSAFLGQTAAAVYLTAAVAVHGVLWVVLHRRRQAEHERLHAGVEAYLREG